MVLTLAALMAGAALGLLSGGSLGHLASHRVRSWWLLLAGLGLREAAGRVDLGVAGIVVLMAGFACLLAFAAVNRTFLGMGIVAFGLAANAVVMVANGGMPVRDSAIESAGIAGSASLATVDYGRFHHREGTGDQLRWLGDIVPVPGVHEVLSFGDLVLAVGIADVVIHLLRRRRRPPTVMVPAALLRPEPLSARDKTTWTEREGGGDDDSYHARRSGQRRSGWQSPPPPSLSLKLFCLGR